VGTVILTEDNFESVVDNKGIVLIDCWAPWCGACKTFEPVFEHVAEKYPDHKFGKINTQDEEKLVSALGIENIPTLLLYRDGILLFRQPGYFEEEKLEEIVNQAESLDMDDVRAQIRSEQESNK
jgi:thioredoxin 1